MSRNRSLPLAALALLIALTPAPSWAQSSALSIQVDRSQRVQLRGTVASVIVGNPQIADVTVVNANTLFVTGKGYGVTDIVAVDAIGRTLFQNQVVVSSGRTGSVRMWRGSQATEMACASSCAPSVRSSGLDSAAAPTP